MRRILRAVVGVVLAGCSPAVHESASSQPLPAHGVAAPSSSVVPARWVPRIAPAVSQGRFGQPMYGPVQNNFGTRATVYVARDTVALVDKGKRWLWKDATITAINLDDGSAGLETIDHVAPALGDGFVFTGKAGVFYAPKIDAPLVALSKDAAALVGIGPHGVMLRTGYVGFDGKPIATAPVSAVRMVVNPAGFGVAETPAGLFFSTDGRAWKPLGPILPTWLAVDGETLVAVESAPNAVRITQNGAAKRIKLTEEERDAYAMKSMVTETAPDDGFEGSIAEQLWSRTDKDDVRVHIDGRDILVRQGRNGTPRKIGVAPDDGCMTLMVERPLVVCMALGQRLQAYRLDVATGALSLERDVKAKPGSFVRMMGTVRGTWPTTLYIQASCDGDPAGGICVRDDHGAWTTLPLPPSDARALVFPGEIFHMGEGPHGEWQLHSQSALVSSISPPAFLVPAKNAKLEDVKVTDLGVLRTDGEIVFFMGPNPYVPIVSPTSYAIRFPVGAGVSAATLVSVPGVVAAAGMKALRLDGDKLYETEDGWKTWREVAPPPTGPLPDLAGAMCWDSGCTVAPWMRVGWTH